MRFQPAVLANAMRNRGIPIAREQLAKRQSGLHIFKAGGAMVMEWVSHPDLPAESRIGEAVEALRGLGYKVERAAGELYSISEKTAEEPDLQTVEA